MILVLHSTQTDAVVSTLTAPWSADQWVSRRTIAVWHMARARSKPLSPSFDFPSHSGRKKIV